MEWGGMEWGEWNGAGVLNVRAVLTACHSGEKHSQTRKTLEM